MRSQSDGLARYQMTLIRRQTVNAGTADLCRFFRGFATRINDEARAMTRPEKYRSQRNAGARGKTGPAHHKASVCQNPGDDRVRRPCSTYCPVGFGAKSEANRRLRRVPLAAEGVDAALFLRMLFLVRPEVESCAACCCSFFSSNAACLAR